MLNTNNIAICATDPKLLDKAEHLAQQLSLPLVKSPSTIKQDDSSDFGFLLSLTRHIEHEYRLELNFPKDHFAPLYVDFQNQSLLYRQKYGGGRQQPLARAIGLKYGLVPCVVDATAGLGRDAFILASLGCRVHMLERNPIIHALVNDGLRRLTNSGANTKFPNSSLSLDLADSLPWLQSFNDVIDVIYLDPMYPHRSKSALVKKEMRVLRQLVGDDLDVESVLEYALSKTQNRVVVKRPKTASPIGKITPSHSISAKNTRFDVYLTHP